MPFCLCCIQLYIMCVCLYVNVCVCLCVNVCVCLCVNVCVCVCVCVFACEYGCDDVCLSMKHSEHPEIQFPCVCVVSPFEGAFLSLIFGTNQRHSYTRQFVSLYIRCTKASCKNIVMVNKILKDKYISLEREKKLGEKSTQKVTNDTQAFTSTEGGGGVGGFARIAITQLFPLRVNCIRESLVHLCFCSSFFPQFFLTEILSIIKLNIIIYL